MEVQFGKPLFRMDGNGKEWTSRAANGAKNKNKIKMVAHGFVNIDFANVAVADGFVDIDSENVVVANGFVDIDFERVAVAKVFVHIDCAHVAVAKGFVDIAFENVAVANGFVYIDVEHVAVAKGFVDINVEHVAVANAETPGRAFLNVAKQNTMCSICVCGVLAFRGGPEVAWNPICHDSKCNENKAKHAQA